MNSGNFRKYFFSIFFPSKELMDILDEAAARLPGRRKQWDTLCALFGRVFYLHDL